MKFQVNMMGHPSGEQYRVVVSAQTKEQARKRVLRQLQHQFCAESDFTTDNILSVSDSIMIGFVQG